jgi:hypothetical protein
MAWNEDTEWITANEAGAILTANTDHQVHPDYIRVLVRAGQVQSRKLNGRYNLYLRSDVEKIRIRPRKGE